ncbi:uncharacterized protein LOC116434949 isoform X2 [Nomia melanderi]|uniref:uncharacterized protein LOC116434949 isoform X2 n=1 Tax=Nomia melanderi TaxID=2448451 RepID=UPI0013041086|nr:uncharacterized protein LOC116434949 [Nomia melanderi]
MVHCFKFIKQKKQRYISWNILFLWGFGLWIALCTSNIYHSDILTTRATLISQQNWNPTLTYNIMIETEPVENLTYITATNYTLCSTILPLKVVLQYMYVPISMCFALILLCIREHIRKSIKILNDIIYNIHSIDLYSKTIARDQSNYAIKRRTVTQNSDCILQSKLIIHYEISAQYLQKKCSYTKLEEYILKEHVQNGITFSRYTFFLFNSYTIYSLNNQQLQTACNLLTKYSEICKSEYTKTKLLPLNNDNRKISNIYIKKSLQNGIITSSPEFKKFLANLRSRNFYPCMLGMSANYVIRKKLIYK